MSAKRGSALMSASVTGLGNGPTARTSTQFQRPVGSVEFGVDFRHDADHAHDALFIDGMIEEAQVANLHGPHVLLGERITDPAPFLALGASLELILPGEGARLRLEQPKSHA